LFGSINFLDKYNYDKISPGKNYKEPSMATVEELQAEIADLKEKVKALTTLAGQAGNSFSRLSTAAGSILGPFGSLFDATVKGTTGVSAYNNALDLSGEELKKLAGTTSIFGIALGTASESLKLYVKMAGAQADALMKSYQDLSSVGAAGKADLTDTYETMRKFGATSKEDLPKITQMVGQNAEMLSKLGGTVSQGMKQFADVSASIQQTGLQTEFMNMGMSVDSINKGIAGYLKIQTQSGQAQKMTQEQLNAGAADYLKQLDNLSKLTGKSAEALGKEREERLNDEKFAIMRRQQNQVVARGGAEGARMAETIKQQDELLARIKQAGGAEAEKAAMYTMGGYGAQTEEGRKMLMQMPEVVKMIQDVSAGAKISNDAIMKQAGESTTRFIDTMGGVVAAGGKNVGLNMATSQGFENTEAGEKQRQAAQIAAGQKPTTASEDAKAQQDAQTKATGESVAAMVELTQKQRDAAINLSDMSTKGIVPAAQAMGILAGKVTAFTDILPGTRERTAVQQNQQSGGLISGQPGFNRDLPFPGMKSSEVERKAQEEVNKFIIELGKSFEKATAAAGKIGVDAETYIKNILQGRLQPTVTPPAAAVTPAAPAAAPAAPAGGGTQRTVPSGRDSSALPSSGALLIARGFINIESAENIRFPEMSTAYQSSLDPEMMSRFAGQPATGNTSAVNESTAQRSDAELIAANVLVSQKLDDLIDIMRKGVGYQRKISMSASA
jgi:hypothetical protein